MDIYRSKHLFRQMYHICIVILVMQIFSVQAKVDSSLLCSSGFCDDYDDDKCQATSDDCQINNATNAGVNMLSPTFCNCCPYCLSYLWKEEYCTKGALGSPPSGNICGPSLYCTATDDDAVCLRMDSECHSEQDNYEANRLDGSLGFLVQKPVCDGDGNYGPVKCIPGQTCFCVSQEGDRIFGEVINEKSVEETMHCSCSRNITTMEKVLAKDGFGGPRCLPDGSFDRLQCVKNRCFCIDRNTGVITNSKIIDLVAQHLTLLPCYDSELHYSTTVYLKPCEKRRAEVLEIIQQYKREGFEHLGDPLPSCQADGNYYKIQINGTKKVCVTPEGDQIEDYGAPISNDKNMNCNCARTAYLLQLSEGSHALPTCCANGNWRAIQCRRNYCYCVDQNGSQIGTEVDITEVNKLKACYTSTWEKC